MSSEWSQSLTIAELITKDGGSIKTGPFGTSLKASEYVTEGVPLISVREIGHGSFHIDSKTPRVSSDTLARLPEYILEERDIVFARKGGIERCSLVRKKQAGWFLGSDGIRLRPPKTCDARFLAYSLQTQAIKNWLTQNSTGSTMASLNQATIGRLPISLPHNNEQIKIADLLEALDDRISLLRETNTTLETISQTLFKSWFVDFDPVRAKKEGREPEGMDADTAALFPDSFEESEMGLIPKGWSIRTLGSILSLDKGLSYKGDFLTNIGVPMVNLGCFKGQGRFSEDTYKPYSGEFKERHTVKPFDLVLANTDITQKRVVIGSPALIPPNADIDNGKLIFTHHVYAARFKAEEVHWKLYVYFLLLQDGFRERAIGYATGTTVLSLPRDTVLEFQITEPTSTLRDEFNLIVMPLFKRQWENERKVRTLASIRDTLLPRLISGQLRLSDTEALSKQVHND